MAEEAIANLVAVGWFKEPHISVLLSADFRCEYCGHDLLSTFNDCFNAQADHIYPRSKGGSEEVSNLAASCTTCNSLKWDYVPIGEDRAEQIADAARYVLEQRKDQEASWIKYRELIGR